MRNATEEQEQLRSSLAQAATDAGYDVWDLNLLRIGNNYVFEDPPNRKIYRVPVKERQPKQVANENAILRELVEHGAPILGPLQIEPIELSTGQLATVWPLGDQPNPDPTISLAPTLALLHQTDVASGMEPWSGFKRAYDRIVLARAGQVPTDMLDEIDERICEMNDIAPRWPQKTVVHGDPHVGNLVQIQDRHLLIDLDDLALGCPEIDLAPMRVSYQRFPGMAGSWDSFLAAYDRQVDMDLVEWFAELRQLTMVAWMFTLWDLRPEARPELEHRIRTLNHRAEWNPL